MSNPNDLNYENIERPYDDFLNRSVEDVASEPNNINTGGNNEVLSENDIGGEESSISSSFQIDDKTIGSSALDDLWIVNFIKSKNYKPKIIGFYINGQTGDIEANNLTAIGSITASSGTIGGWVISTTGLSSSSSILTSSIFLDSTNGLIRVGSTAGNYITVDGANLRIRSSNYVAGISGAGFTLEPDLLEVGNIRARGMIRTAVFQKDVISAVGGIVQISNADTLASDMTALDASTLTISGATTFSVNDILHIKDGVDDEYLRVTNVASAPTYTVTRDLAASYAADTNPTWKKGAAVVKEGSSDGAATYSGGFLRLFGEGTNSPYYSVYARTGVAYNAITERVRLGNLNGFLGYSSDIYGIAIGETGQSLKYDSTNGLVVEGDIRATRTLAPGDFTAGEALLLGDALYYKASDGKVWKADTDVDESTYNFIGFSDAAYSLGATDVNIVTGGVISNPSWTLTAGSWYFLTGTAGSISTTPGSRVLEVGIAISTTGLLIVQRKPRQTSGTATLIGTTTSSITTGFRPARVLVFSQKSGASRSNGSSDGTNNQCVYYDEPNNTSNLNASVAWMIGDPGFADSHSGVCDNFSSTGFRLNQTKASGADATVWIHWVALG